MLDFYPGHLVCLCYVRRLDPVKNALENVGFLLLFPFPPPPSLPHPPGSVLAAGFTLQTLSTFCGHWFLSIQLPGSGGAGFKCPRASHSEVSMDLSGGVSGLSSADLPKPLALGPGPVQLCSHRHPIPPAMGSAGLSWRLREPSARLWISLPLGSSLLSRSPPCNSSCLDPSQILSSVPPCRSGGCLGSDWVPLGCGAAKRPLGHQLGQLGRQLIAFASFLSGITLSRCLFSSV